MKAFNKILLVLIAGSTLLSCDIGDIGNDNKEDPAVVEGLTGLWRGVCDGGLTVVIYNLKENRNAVCTRIVGIGIPYVQPLITTVICSPWEVNYDRVILGGDETLYYEGSKLIGFDSRRVEYELNRIYDPNTQTGKRNIPDLTGKTWTGYYNDKVITLFFRGDNTVRRTDTPNVGWEGNTQVREYTWKVEDKVIKFEDEDSISFWGVGLETDECDLIYVDFNDACCAFGDFY